MRLFGALLRGWGRGSLADRRCGQAVLDQVGDRRAGVVGKRGELGAADSVAELAGVVGDLRHHPQDAADSPAGDAGHGWEVQAIDLVGERDGHDMPPNLIEGVLVRTTSSSIGVAPKGL